MKKLLILSIVLLMGLLSACGQSANSGSSSASSNQKKLVMGTSADYPPYEYIDTANGQEPMGFDIDIAKHIAKKLGYTLDIQNMTFKGLIPALNTKRVDFVMAGMTPTADRKKSVDFSTVYYTAQQVVLTKKSLKIQSIKDLKGKTVGVQLGSIQQNIANQLNKTTPINIKTMDKATDLIEELKSGRIDGVIIEDAVAANILKNNSDLNAFVIQQGDKMSGSAVAFPKNSKLIASFNKELADMKKDGTMKKLKKKWFKTGSAK